MLWLRRIGALGATAAVAVAVWEGGSTYVDLLNQIAQTLTLFGVSP